MSLDLPLEVLVHVFEFSDGARVLCTFALVCRAWRVASVEVELWRRLVARRWAELHSLAVGDVSADALLEPCSSGCGYDIQDVYFRLVRLPTCLHRTSPSLALAPQPGCRAAWPTVATFVGEGLGGNQTARADVPWAASIARGVHAAHAADTFASPPIGMLRAVSPAEAMPPAATHRHAGGAPSHRLRAELQLVHYFEVTILHAPAELRRGAAGTGAAPAYAYERPCVAVGVCTSRFPLERKMPGWDRHSLAFHGDDGCKFHNSNLGEPYGPSFGEGDCVGCGVRIRPTCTEQPAEAQAQDTHTIFFTLNGQLLSDPALPLGALSGAQLYACVGIDTFSPVRVNFGHEPFRFDLRAMHPLAAPAALGLPNPPDRADCASALKAHLRETLRMAAAGQPVDDASGHESQHNHLPPIPLQLAQMMGLPVGAGAAAVAGWPHVDVQQLQQLAVFMAGNPAYFVDEQLTDESDASEEEEDGEGEGNGEWEEGVGLGEASADS
ncbi:hypothetical protein KFE25_006957 [Diacronema lutheri]|uniref:F-box domain-containing protein n=1 Tax=Diacronema lutheri TaxID=2081491 RepID=A0A8J5XYN2_DIALT|nr:hypothetical protein KFE25_006957 [Diacronema lutheri]